MATNTSLPEVFDLFMMIISDYRLVDLYNTDEDGFNTYLEAWLQYAVSEFENICTQDLNYNTTTQEFPAELTRKNKIILAKLMAKYWLEKVVSDITQMNLHITDRDFRIASEAMNLREKKDYFNAVKEECSQLLNDYAYSNNDWNSWYTQDFEGG